MKISELKQPYRRMAEYLAERNTERLENAFTWLKTDDKFWYDIYNGFYPPITKEIKQNFPPDFDFSGEEEAKVTMK